MAFSAPVHHPIVAVMLQAAIAASRAILNVYAQDIQVEHKADSSPVTQADLAAHNTILSLLAAQPYPVISEECDTLPDPLGLHSFFLVDPLDGTRDFVQKNGEFTVNIAWFAERKLSAGVVLAPARGDIYLAMRHQGAWKSTLDHHNQSLDHHNQWSALHIQQRKTTDPLRIGLSRHASGTENSLFAQLRQTGSIDWTERGSSLKIVEIAEGLLDFYPRHEALMDWDTAAAHVILEEAGGQLLNLQGEPLRYAQRKNWRAEAFWAIGSHPRIPQPGTTPFTNI